MLLRQHQSELAEHFHILCCSKQWLSASEGSALGHADVLELSAMLIVHESSLFACNGYLQIWDLFT